MTARHAPIVLAAMFLALMGGLALMAPVLPLVDPNKQVSEERLQSPSARHWLGTDDLGRDLLSRVIHAGRTSLAIGLLSVALAFVVGVPIGILSGYFGGWIDRALNGIVEVVMAFPGILLALVLIAILGPSLVNVMIAVAISQIPLYARQARASAMSVAGQEYVLAARLAGTRTWGIVWRHLLPNVFAPLLVSATMGLGSAILEAAALSFLGLTGDPNRAEWGAMLNTTRERFLDQPWLVLVPGLAITGTVLSCNLLGDALRDWLDPKRMD